MNRDLSTFLEKKSDLPKIIIIYGPTASGKTSISIEIAKEFQGEIISTDSRQIYEEMNIGTGKITEEEKEGIPHYMLDIRKPNEIYSVGEFKKEATKHIQDIFSRGKIPILCGGTGLYIDSILFNFDIPEIPADMEYRDELEKIRIQHGNVYLWKMLQEKDPKYAEILHENNYRYIMRGLEIFKYTWKSKLELKWKKTQEYDFFLMAPELMDDREKLYERINLRVQQMFDENLEKEVFEIIKKFGGTKKDTKEEILKKIPGLNAIGYAELVELFLGKISRKECIELVQKNSRHYAKRQYTWFRKYSGENT